MEVEEWPDFIEESEIEEETEESEVKKAKLPKKRKRKRRARKKKAEEIVYVCPSCGYESDEPFEYCPACGEGPLEWPSPEGEE